MTAVEASPARLYRVTALGSALLRMWRAWAILVPVIVVNAAIQALLILPNVTPGLTPAFIVLAVVSLLVLVAAFLVVLAALLQSTTGSSDAGEVLAVARRRVWPLLAWAVGLLIVVLIGIILFVVPGLIVLALTPYLLIAVVDGQRSPLAVNFRTIGARWGRWLVTVVVMGGLSFGVWLLSAVDGFFVTGAPGAFIGWLLAGFVSSWFACAWVLIYRSVNR